MRSYTSKKPPSEMRNTSIQRCRAAGKRSMRAETEAAAAGGDGGGRKAVVMVEAVELMLVSGQQTSVGASRGAVLTGVEVRARVDARTRLGVSPWQRGRR